MVYVTKSQTEIGLKKWGVHRVKGRFWILVLVGITIVASLTLLEAFP